MCAQTQNCCKVEVPLIHPSTAGVLAPGGRLVLVFLVWPKAERPTLDNGRKVADK